MFSFANFILCLCTAGKLRSFPTAQRLFNAVQMPNVVSYTALLSAWARDHPARARWVKERQDSTSSASSESAAKENPRTSAPAPASAASGASGSAVFVTNLLSAMALQGVAPDPRCFAAAAHALSVDGHWKPARKLLSDLQWSCPSSRGDLRTFNAVLQAYERAGGQGRAAFILLQQGPGLFGVQPNVKSYQICLQACVAEPQQRWRSSSSRSPGISSRETADERSNRALLASDALAAWAARPRGVRANVVIETALRNLQARVDGQPE